MPFYQKRPIVIEALQLTEANQEEVAIWCSGDWEDIDGIIIKTLEGNMLADFGDYIIKGIKGEFYPCKSDIFEASYQLVE